MLMFRPYVLVVDNDKITTKLMRRYLEGNGFETDEAGDASKAQEIYVTFGQPI